MDDTSWSSWFDRAADVGVAYLNRNRPAAARPVVATPPPNAQPPWLKPVLIGGGVLALVAVLIAAFRK